MSDNRNWKFFRKRNGNLKWYQRWYEAYLIISGKHSLHRAWQLGHDHGTGMEYARTSRVTHTTGSPPEWYIVSEWDEKGFPKSYKPMQVNK